MKQTNKPIDPATFDAKMHGCDMQIQQLERERADRLHQLAGDPDNAKVHQLVIQLDAEIAAGRAMKTRLLKAREEAARRFNAGAHLEYVESLEADRQKLAEVNRAIEVAAAAFINELAPALATHLQRLDDLANQRAALVHGISRAGRETGSPLMKRVSEMARMRGQRGIGQAAVIAIRAALYRAGLGRLAPEIGIEAPPPPELPGRTGLVYSPSDSRSTRVAPDHRYLWRDPAADLTQLMAAERVRELDHENHLVQTAIEAVKQAAPGGAR